MTIEIPVLMRYLRVRLLGILLALLLPLAVPCRQDACMIAVAEVAPWMLPPEARYSALSSLLSRAMNRHQYKRARAIAHDMLETYTEEYADGWPTQFLAWRLIDIGMPAEAKSLLERSPQLLAEAPKGVLPYTCEENGHRALVATYRLLMGRALVCLNRGPEAMPYLQSVKSVRENWGAGFYLYLAYLEEGNTSSAQSELLPFRYAAAGEFYRLHWRLTELKPGQHVVAKVVTDDLLRFYMHEEQEGDYDTLTVLTAVANLMKSKGYESEAQRIMGVVAKFEVQ